MNLRPPDHAAEGRRLTSEAEPAGRESTERRCFLCDRPFRPGVGEPIDGGEGIDLCIGCGAIYAGGCGC